jgi:hypothetical protein
MEQIIGYIFLFIFFIVVAFFVKLTFSEYQKNRIFKQGRNKYSRICKRCGATQDNYSYANHFGGPTWWEEMYPMGNDPNCICRRYANNDNQ